MFKGVYIAGDPARCRVFAERQWITRGIPENTLDYFLIMDPLSCRVRGSAKNLFMNAVETNIAENGRGHFYVTEDGLRAGEMEFSIAGDQLTVYHTEVFESAKGKGLGKVLLTAMVEYARGRQLHVIPLCPYVYAQFKRNKEQYADIWQPGDTAG